MGRTARRAAWNAAALSAVLGAVWFAASLDERSDVIRGTLGSAHDADPRGELHPERRDSAPGSATHRRERRHAEPEPTDRSGADAKTAKLQDGTGPVVEANRAMREELDRLARAMAAGGENLRSTSLPGEAPRVVARNWTPARESRTPVAGMRPSTTTARDPGAADAADTRLDDAALDVAKTHGLRGDYFDVLDGSIVDIPDVSKWPTTFSRIDLAIDFDTDESFALPFVPDTFLVRWTGFLRAPDDFAYRFTCGSDDGARVSIDGKVVIDQPRLRPYAESSGAVKLSAGLHPIEILFYENYGYASCRLWWDGPNWKRRIVAPEFLTPPKELADVTPPVIASVEPPSGFVDDTVTIRGAGFSNDASLMRVTFHNVPAEIVEASGDRLTVKVPIGAATGDVVVQTGVLSSMPRPFAVKNLLGLYAEYFKLDGELKDYPDFDHLAPYFVRLDANLDFMDDNLWKLPYTPDVFGARYTGFLYAPADDDYRVTLGSDDGARVTLDGKPWLEMPGLHGYTEQTRTTHLAQGFHAIEVIFFENYGAARLALYWQRATDVTRSVIPEGFFYAPRELTDLPAPAIASLAPAAAEIGSEMEVRGSGFGTSTQLARVVFPGDVWARPISVDDEHLRVRVPFGATSGDLHVEVGVQSSNHAAFTVASPQGLVADYFTFADKASLAAAASPEALAKLTPAFTRIETDWQRLATKDWNLPFPATAFAVHWHGTLGVEYPTDIAWILRSAAGAWLDVDGRRADDCGPWHELTERYGGSHLEPGEHRFDLWFVQADAEPRIQLLYTPVGRLDHLPVPGRWFLPRESRP